MANRAIGALIIAGCLRIANNPELNEYCGSQLQPGGEGSIEYINEYLPTQISDPQELMRISIEAQRGFDNGWTFEQMGIGEDGLPVLQMTPPIIFKGVSIDLDDAEKTSIKTFWLNFKNILCSMKTIFSNLSPWAQLQAALMAVGALKTANQILVATRSAIDTFTTGINSVFEWWRNTGQKVDATESIKNSLDDKTKVMTVVDAIKKLNRSGIETPAYDVFYRKNKQFIDSTRHYELMQRYDAPEGIGSWSGRTFIEHRNEDYRTGRFGPDEDRYDREEKTHDREEKTPEGGGRSKRKRTKRRKQSKKKTKRRKTTRRSRRSSSRKR